VAVITGIFAVQAGISRRLHDAVPSSVRTGASSVVSTVSYAVFIPMGLAFGLVSRDSGTPRASLLVLACLAAMGLALAGATAAAGRLRAAGRVALRAAAAGIAVAGLAVISYHPAGAGGRGQAPAAASAGLNRLPGSVRPQARRHLHHRGCLPDALHPGCHHPRRRRPGPAS
jgi:hypothetical protein